MLGLLRSWVLNIVSIIIFITFLEILLPNSSIKKYIKMIVGLLVMLIILNPLLDLVNGKVKIEDEIFMTSNLLEQKSLALSIDTLEEQQNHQVIEYYKTRLENSIKERLEYEKNIEVLQIQSNIDEDINSKDFGKIVELNIAISRSEFENDPPNNSSEIPTIKISLDNTTKRNKSSPSDLENIEIIDDIKSSIANMYPLEKDKVNISVE